MPRAKAITMQYLGAFELIKLTGPPPSRVVIAEKIEPGGEFKIDTGDKKLNEKIATFLENKKMIITQKVKGKIINKPGHAYKRL